MTAVGSLLRIAHLLGSGITSGIVLANSVVVLADEGWQGVLVVLKTRSRVVRRACATEVQSRGIAGVVGWSTTAKGTTRVDLGGAPLGSGRQIDRGCGERKGIIDSDLRSDEAGEKRDHSS